ncbi:secretin N-terminal domain-containing protein [Thalassotalea euphylliae]|uniref:Uncharacterized protein n=1 Tax=Thalassotalea euphylliae TaxID=1655234 RepID=A0A3E0TZY1_9GAMM|nr:secretin N-terminal domain-containing protein [Thalassotalea euphylliae]REL30226.1 hypothetical protein DXX94_05625 [Thalassotalea euphylliae]
MVNFKVSLVSICLMTVLTGCASNGKGTTQEVHTVEKSFLKNDDEILLDSDAVSEGAEGRVAEKQFTSLSAMERGLVQFESKQLSSAFSDKEMVSVKANKMPLTDFIHYTFGELLKVNYVLAPSIGRSKEVVTLNLNEAVSKRELFLLTEQIFAQRSIQLKHENSTFLINQIDPKSKSSTIVSMGREATSVEKGRNILHIMPVLYGIKTSLKNTVQDLTEVKVNLDVKQSALFIRGNYTNVVRAVELVQLLDSPANRGRHVGLVKLVYSSPDIYLAQLQALLETEGIPNSINDPQNNNLVFVPLMQIGAVAVFSATKELMERVEFWTKTLDKPPQGDVKRYYVYHPKYARAADIGESLTPLISARTQAIKNSSAQLAVNKADAAGNTTGNLKKSKSVTGASNGDLTFVVDERSNALIFYTSGTEYRNIIPLVNRLDVLPKQVMLDIVVAEVTLTDNFRYGVKWALQNGRFSGGTIGDVSASDGGFSFSLTNGGNDSITAAFSQGNSNIKILSNPSILVRDGVTASLEVGEQISVTDSVTDGFDSTDRQTTTSSYRQTGIKVSVTPTINAQGVVIMDISESISNEVESSASSATGNPNIFERNIATAVVAESGQTIILGGLIDENKSIIDNKVPLLGDIPILGNLFKSKNDSYSKTELVLLVTPKVISRSEQWGGIMSSFKQSLSGLDVVE